MSDPQPDPAVARWAIMQAVRLLGVATLMVGILHQAGRIAWLDGIPAWFGYILIGVGIIETFYLPLLLARQWKSPPQ